MTKSQQLILDLALRPALGREDFMVTQSNAAALQLIDQWPNWPGSGAVIIGPPGSGKSHLIEVFRKTCQLAVISAQNLSMQEIPELTLAEAIVIEDVLPGFFDERLLFHALNLAKQNTRLVLLTAQTSPSSWTIALPDLSTRLLAFPVVPLLLPDDELLRAVLLKHFQDRQLAVSPAVLAYLVSHMPRSLDAARQIASEIDRRSMVQKVEITRPFVAEIVRRLAEPPLVDVEKEP